MASIPANVRTVGIIQLSTYSGQDVKTEAVSLWKHWTLRSAAVSVIPKGFSTQEVH